MYSDFVYLFIFLILIGISTGRLHECQQNATCGCSSVSSVSINSRIVGGERAPDHAWGWMVSLQLYESHRCGASLISSMYAITAAHCVEGIENEMNELSILAGTNYLYNSLAPNAQRRRIIAITIHPNYDSNLLSNDIALLRFSRLSTGSASKLSFICLPNPNRDPFRDGTDLVATGWGTTSEGTSVSNALRQVTVKVIRSNSRECMNAPIENTTVQFCAGLYGGGKGELFLFQM
jgi:secreted trypsin-like serine protease